MKMTSISTYYNLPINSFSRMSQLENRSSKTTEAWIGPEKTGEKSTLKPYVDQKKGLKTTKWPEKWPEKSKESRSQKTSQKTSQKIIDLIKEDAYISTPKMADIIGIDRRNIARNVKKLQEQGLIRHVGPDKGGHWEVIEQNEKGGDFLVH